mmetsp:Transcript_22946/g.22275  ORF Transcript_22946/g.22275 Transcript_22946/m.22275 type:complete len:123 (+) Transcript_22946:2253-2621(+)
MVSSSSTLPSQSSQFTFTLTISVDTPIGATLILLLPPQISVDSSMETNCYGQMNLALTTSCYQLNETAFSFELRGNNVNDEVIGNGTTVSVVIENLINPISMEQSDSFTIYTYVIGREGSSK